VDLVQKSDILELVTEPSLALSVFRLNPYIGSSARCSLTDLNDLNCVFYDRILARHDILLTQTVLNGVTCVRFAIGVPRTEETHIDQAFKLLQEEGRIAIREWKAKGGSDTFLHRLVSSRL
jgi:aromatic-L-amino-acid/L-tryptophan decarboxylase